jgi:GNAT superfamily N-acetyltransferase
MTPAGVVEIIPLAASLPADFSQVVEESIGEGYRFLGRMRGDWASGAPLFSAPGECLFWAHFGGETVGVCGRAHDPYVIDDGVGRIRHLYVRRGFRNQGVGSRLMTAAISGARLHFSELRLRTTNPDAARLYLKHGFHAVAGDENATHRLGLGPRGVNPSTIARRTW